MSSNSSLDGSRGRLGSENSTNKRIRYEPDADRTPDGGYKIKTYYPTLEQMKDFNAYIKLIHEDGGHRAGLAKIIPPLDYKPRKAGYADENLYKMEISSPIRQVVTGEGGLYQQMNIEGKQKMTVRKFKHLSEQKHPTPEHSDQASLDRAFWKNVFTNPSLYGADVPGTLFDDDCNEFNLTRLNTILDDIKVEYGVTIQGVNTTYLYFGMWKSSFCWHTEDVDLYSINYLHTGAPKSWYCIAPEYGKRFERLAESFFPHSLKSCKAFLRHKTTLISPQVLKKYSIPFSRCTQEAGQFMITFPYSYHSGYNNGYNIAEATNFATEYWIEFGKWATRCECSSESVKISMQTFVKRYQSERYDDWIRGKDICKDPRDPRHVAAAPKPTEHDLYVWGAHKRVQEEAHMDLGDEEDRKKEALQQNLSINLKTKSKSHQKKKVNSIEENLQLYSDYLRTLDATTNDQNDTSSKSRVAAVVDSIPSWSPITNARLVASNEFIPVKSVDKFEIDLKSKPDYEKYMRRIKKEQSKSKKEDTITQKKEQKAKERMIKSQELLQFLPVSFTHEKKFNRCIAVLPPHCSICQLLVPHPKDNEEIWGSKNLTDSTSPTQEPAQQTQPMPSQDNDPETSGVTIDVKQSTAPAGNEEFELPDTSEILLPKVAFYRPGWYYSEEDLPDGDERAIKLAKLKSITDETETFSSQTNRDEFIKTDIARSELLQCAVCMLAVHKMCYGITNMPSSRNDWVCDRCLEPQRSTLNCSLCPCRGGALKLVDRNWVHITCALLLPNVKLTDLTSSESKNRGFKLPDIVEEGNCIFCDKMTNMGKYIQGKTVKCLGDEENGCDVTFHPTCGHRNGMTFELLNYHTDPTTERTIGARCSSCFSRIPRAVVIDDPTEEVEPEELEHIRIGTSVIAKNKEGILQDGIVNGYEKNVSYGLYFAAGNETDLIPERYISNLDRKKEFQIGDTVMVKKKDKLIKGKFRFKKTDACYYLVRFHKNFKSIQANRKDIFLNIDQLSEAQLEEYLKSSHKKSLDADDSDAQGNPEQDNDDYLEEEEDFEPKDDVGDSDYVASPDQR